MEDDRIEIEDQATVGVGRTITLYGDEDDDALYTVIIPAGCKAIVTIEKCS